MAVPTPAVPNFTDGQLLAAAGLNALGSNATNLWNALNAGFFTQRPMALARQTTGQIVNSATDTLVNFQSAGTNTDNMFVPSQATQLTIQHAGNYLLFGQARYPAIGGSTTSMYAMSAILVNGTALGNSVCIQPLVPTATGNGVTPFTATVQNLAVGATLYLYTSHNTGAAQTLPTDGGASCLGAVFLTPSS